MTLSTNMLYVMSRDLNNIRILGQVVKFAQEHAASLTVLDVIDSVIVAAPISYAWWVSGLLISTAA